MTVSKHRIPTLCRIAKRNLWYVTLNRKRHDLGVCTAEGARESYDRVIESWISRGRQPLSTAPRDASYLIEGLVADYLEYLDKRFAASEVPNEIKLSLRALRQPPDRTRSRDEARAQNVVPERYPFHREGDRGWQPVIPAPRLPSIYDLLAQLRGDDHPEDPSC